MLKKLIKKTIYKICAEDYSEINQIIKNYEVISFDIFDTLIKRNVKDPADIFSIVEKKYNKQAIHFKENRIQAEKIARKKSQYEEVTLKEIYEELDYPKNIKEELYKIEIQVEKEYCTSNHDFKQIYNYCLENKKRIFLTSDMYLPKDIIEDILKDNGYKGYEKLYLSSDKRATKYTGNLFKNLIQEENIDKDKIIHIGDSLTSDYFKPKKLKIKSILIHPYRNNCLFTSKNNHTLDYNILNSFINNHINSSADYYSKFGYEVLGPILYSFTTWIHQKVHEDHIDKIYFLARDAKIIMDVYKERFGEELPTYYIRVSKRSMVISSTEKINDYDDIYHKAKSLFNEVTTVQDMFDIFLLKNIDYSLPNKLLNELNDEQKNDLFNIVKNPLEKICKKQNQYLKDYLKQNDFSGNIALIDIGWNGTTQYNFKKYSKDKTKLYGYYYGVFRSKKFPEYKNLNRNGFLFDESHDINYQSIINLSMGIFETMFLSNECSTIGYQEKDNIIVPIYAEKDNDDNNVKYIMNIQNNAKKFIKDVKESQINQLDHFSKDTYFENYKNFSISPTLKNIKMFKNIKFANVKKIKLINNKSLFFYIFHPKKFYLDFRESFCKLMFLKSIFKIKLPYYKVLKKLYIKEKSI